MSVAGDTRDGIRLIIQVKPNQGFDGMVCEGANILPSKFLEDAFCDSYGGRLTNSAYLLCLKNISLVCHLWNGSRRTFIDFEFWCQDVQEKLLIWRGLFGLVSSVEILSGGIIRLQVAEAEVNNISICFLDSTLVSNQMEDEA